MSTSGAVAGMRPPPSELHPATKVSAGIAPPARFEDHYSDPLRFPPSANHRVPPGQKQPRIYFTLCDSTVA